VFNVIIHNMVLTYAGSQIMLYTSEPGYFENVHTSHVMSVS
jgi:hypothetical protein